MLPKVAPGVVAFLYAATAFDGHTVERVTVGIAIGSLITLGGMLAMALASVTVTYLRGRDDAQEGALLRSARFWAGVLVFACMWMWVQYTRHETERVMLQCVSSIGYVESRSVTDIQDEIAGCYDDSQGSDYDWD